MKKIAVVFFLWIMFLMASGQASDMKSDLEESQAMACFNYDGLKNQLLDLNSQRVYAKSKFKRLRLERKIDKLMPSYMEWQVQCLGSTIEPN